MKSEFTKGRVWITVHHGDRETEIGSWPMCSADVNNSGDQRDLGWHVFCALVQGADKVIVRREE